MTTRPDPDRKIAAWLHDEAPDHAPSDVLEASRERVEKTRQRRSWWPARRGTQMSTYAKLAAAAATVLVITVGGTAFMLGGIGGQPSPQPTTGGAPQTQQPTAPGATASDVLLPGEFTACVPRNAASKTGTTETGVVPGPDGDLTIERTRGFTWLGLISATDPRFSGTHYYSWDGNGFTAGAADPYAQVVDGFGTWAEGHRIETAEGAWAGSTVGITLPDGTNEAAPAVLTGEGAYQGLTAVMFPIDGPCLFDFRGFVIEVPAPPVPYTGG
jgi:hypothetical protein